MSAGFSLANTLAILAAGRDPVWVDHPNSSGSHAGAPSTSTSGVYLEDAVVAQVRVRLRRAAHRREAWITVDTRDTAANYTATVNGTAIATTSGSFATNDSVLVELKAKVLADATVGGAAASPTVTAVLLDSAGAETNGTAAGGNAAVTLVVRGVVEADWTIAVSASGSGVLACVAEATFAVVRVWTVPNTNRVASGSTGPVGTSSIGAWDVVGEGIFDITRRGWEDTLAVPGRGYLYVEVDELGTIGDGASVTYSCAGGTSYPGGGVFVGPCLTET